MVLSDEKKKEYMKRLLMSRLRILVNNGFYGLLLMHMIFSIDENCSTAATDGRRIYFGPVFLDDLSDSELDFIMMHEILHVALKHCFRQGNRNNERFNIACDIDFTFQFLLCFAEFFHSSKVLFGIIEIDVSVRIYGTKYRNVP